MRHLGSAAIHLHGMGKKHHKAVPPSSSGGGSMEMQAAEEMQAGRFRKARDLYKALCKEDRARYLPGLIESNRALARQLMEKGQIPEAQQVIAYLKTIAPQSALSVIDFEAAVGSRDWARACDCAFTLLGEPGTAIEGGLRLLIADVLVLGFPAREMVAARLADPFRTELGIILEALRGISETRYEAVQELIRPLPRGSMFAEWKVYIKGLLAFYGGDPVKAKTLFSQLSKGTTPEQAAHAFGPFWGERLPAPKESGRERAMVSLCAVLGEPLLGPALAQADQQWREGHFIGSYKKMRAVPGFPREETTLAGALSEFYMKACSAMSSAHYWDYVRSFDEFAATNSFKNPEEARLVYRMLMVEMARDPNDAPLEQYSRDFLALFPETDRYRNKIASLVLEHAGAYYAREKPHFRFAAPRKKGHRGIPLLEESIALDPANLGAYLKLLDLYEAGKKKSERNRLLDTMTLLFPREKGVLVRAGRECVERKAWGKGLDYFERAHELDRLDPGIVVELVEALERGAEFLTDATERAMRLLLVGATLGR